MYSTETKAGKGNNLYEVNILFVCSRNKWRSRTAETIFRNLQNHDIKSAGTEKDARIKVTDKLLNWADLIFVMEKRHKERLNEKFGVVIADKKIVILDIEDNYQYMDAELIETLKLSVAPYLGRSDEDHQISKSDSLD